jgi:IS30 family transposase
MTNGLFYGRHLIYQDLMVKQVSDHQKGAIIAYKASGKSKTYIANQLGLHHSTISNVLGRHAAGESVDRKKGSGRPRKTSVQTDRLIIREMMKDPFITAKEIQNNLALNVDSDDEDGGVVDLCLETIRNRIKENGEFNSYWAARKPFISPENKLKRVEWCLARRHWTIQD